MHFPFIQVPLMCCGFFHPVGIPRHATVNEPVLIQHRVTNNSLFQMADVQVSVDTVDAFVFSGCKSSNLRLLPMQSMNFSYQIWPLAAGLVKLPHFHVSTKRKEGTEEKLSELAATTDSQTIFVKPATSPLR